MPDHPLPIPVPGEPVEEGTSKVNDQDYGLLKMRIHESSSAAHARRIDGADAYAENLRYDYLEGKANVSLTESLGPRYLQGPHPQFGSPDAAKA